MSGSHPPTNPPSLAPAPALYADGETVPITEVAKSAPSVADKVPRSSPVATTLKGGDPVPVIPSPMVAVAVAAQGDSDGGDGRRHLAADAEGARDAVDERGARRQSDAAAVGGDGADGGVGRG